jgi:dTDP-4-amino-4,6-dideoxygalactose transaminase
VIPLFKVFMAPNAGDEVSDVLHSGYIAQGPRVDAFEEALAGYFGNESLVTVNSGTAALHLALHLLDVGPGDEVITTAQTCVATNGGIVLRGATPVFVDVDPGSGLIDPESVAAAITPKTKAIMAVDWAGHPCDYDELRKHGIPVIQDAAHAVGTMYQNRHVAQSGGDYVCFSFQAIKHLTCGDGGALVVPPEQLDRARRLRWFGLDRNPKNVRYRFEQDIAESGYKFHMNDIAATIGLANFPHLPGILERHALNALELHARLSGIKGVELPPKDLRSSWWLFTVKVDDPGAFADKMAERGVMCSPAHARNDRMTTFSSGRCHGELVGLGEFASKQISIPVGWWVTEEDLETIAEAVEECA